MELQLLDKLVQHVQEHGFKKTIAVLSPQPRDTKADQQKELYVQMVLNVVSKEFDIELPMLLDCKYVRNNGNNKFAIGFCVYYLLFKKSMKEINQEIFKNRTYALLNKYKKMIDNLNPSYRNDKPLIEIKSKLDKIIIK